MITYKCDLCGKEWPAKERANDGGYTSSNFVYAKSIALKSPSQSCFECEAKIEKAKEKAAKEAEAKTREAIAAK